MALVQVDSAQIQELVTAVATLKTDTSTSLADIAAKLGSISSTADPATATALQGVLSDIATLDGNIKAADPAAAVAPATGA